MTQPITTKNPFTVPGAPGKPEISNVTKNSLLLIWQPSKENGGSDISNYVIERKEKTAGRWIRATTRQITDCRFKITGLQEEKEYEFQVSVPYTL